MWTWLSHFDPNVLAIIAGAIVGAFKHKADNKQSANLSSIVKDTLTQVVLQIATLPEAQDRARELLTAAAGAALDRLKIKPSPATALATHAAVEAAMTELHRLLREQGALKSGLDQLAAGAQGVVDAFTPKGTIPSLGLPMGDGK